MTVVFASKRRISLVRFYSFMKAREFLDAMVKSSNGRPLIELLKETPDLITKIKGMPNGVFWDNETFDGWHFHQYPPIEKSIKDRPSDVICEDNAAALKSIFVCELYWKERGANLWGEYFYSIEEAIEWAYNNYHL